MSLRVVFDTNAFHGTSFDAIESSQLTALCQRRKVMAIYPHTFIEETLKAYAREDRRADLVGRWLPLISKTATTLPLDLIQIWHQELVRGRGIHTQRFMKREDFEKFIQSTLHIPLDGSWKVWSATQSERESEAAKQLQQRVLSTEVRTEVQKWAKANKGGIAYAQRLGKKAFAAPHEIVFGKDFIRRHIKCADPIGTANRWANASTKYPFLTQFTQNMIYMFLYAMMDHNKAIDRNAQTDLDIMTHLLHGDILVSNESGFARTAFNEIWKPRGKVMMSAEVFCRFLKKL